MPPSPTSNDSLIYRLRQQSRRLREWTWQNPAGDESAWRRRLRDLLRVLMIFGREFHRDQIPLRASALTFTIILSLVPTLALGTAVLKGLGAGDQMRQAAHRFIDQMESATSLLDDYLPEARTGSEPATPAIPRLTAPGLKPGPQPPATSTPPERAPERANAAGTDPGPQPAPPPDPGDEETSQPIITESSAMHLRQAIDQIFDYVDRTDFAALGAFGVIGMVAAVVIVLGSIEQAMNAIWHTDASRPMGRRVMDYLAMMVLLPLTINLTFAAEATLQSETLREKIQLFLPVGGMEEFLLGLVPFLLLTLVFSILYRFLPNARVKVTPALLGGLFGALAWLIVQGLYLKLQIGVARYNAIYGSFATLPLFLIWMQLCWMILLAGAEMSFAVQARQTYRYDDEEITPVNRLTLAFAVLDIVQRNFKARKLTDPARIARELHQPESVINQVAEQLAAAGLLRGTGPDDETGGGGYLPGTTLEKVKPTEVLDLILGTDIPPIRGGTLTMEAMEAARQAVIKRDLTNI